MKNCLKIICKLKKRNTKKKSYTGVGSEVEMLKQDCQNQEDNCHNYAQGLRSAKQNEAMTKYIS